MNSIDYIYYYQNRYGENVPIVTGKTSDLSMIIFLSKEELLALMDKSNGKRIYVWLNGKSFIIPSI